MKTSFTRGGGNPCGAQTPGMSSRGGTCENFGEFKCITHHVDDLHESQAEAYDDRLGFVGHGPLQGVVLVQQVEEQPLLVRTGLAAYLEEAIKKTKCKNQNKSYRVMKVLKLGFLRLKLTWRSRLNLRTRF